MNILTVNLICSTTVFWIVSRIYVIPKLPALQPETVLLPILILHAFRHLGLMFLAPGAIYDGMPAEFAYPAAFGDLLAALLAVVAIAAIRKGARNARLFVWMFNFEGSADLALAIFLAKTHDAVAYMGAAWRRSSHASSAFAHVRVSRALLLRRHERKMSTATRALRWCKVCMRRTPHRAAISNGFHDNVMSPPVSLVTEYEPLRHEHVLRL